MKTPGLFAAPEATPRARNAFRVSMVILVADIIFAAYSFWSALQSGTSERFLILGITLAAGATAALSAALSRRGRAGLGIGLLIGGLLAGLLGSTFVNAGQGVLLAVAAPLITAAAVLLALGYFVARRYTHFLLRAKAALAEQERLLAEQAAIVARLRELDHLKSSFLANMSHELRTPLNSILGFADVMLMGLDGPLTDQMENDLGLINKNGQHLLSLINDVLDMAKIEAGKMNLTIETFDLREVLHEVADIIGPLARDKSLSLQIESDRAEDLSLEADRVCVRQVMINLVNNAIKFAATGGVTITATRNDDWLKIAVHDTGMGIPPDQIDTVFEEFRQIDTSTTRKAGGTGLGLPISRRLIEMHDGRLWVESTGVPGEGATFHIELPARAAGTAQPAESAALTAVAA